MNRALAIASCAMILVLPAVAQKGKTQKTTTSSLPIVNSISPSSKAAQSGSFILTVTGSNFTTGSVVQWNGSSVSTGYVSGTQLSATIGSSLVASTGSANVTVFTSGRKGGSSNTLTFTITAAVAAPPPPPPPPPPAPTPLSITTSTLPNAIVNGSFNSTVAATGGTPAYGWSLVNNGGSLPPGLTLQANGTLAGTPSQAGTFTFTTQANDNASQVAQKVLSIVVAADPTVPPPPPPEPSPTAPPLFENGLEAGTFAGWNYVSGVAPSSTVNSNPSFKRTGTYSAQFYYNLCGDSTNTACGASAQDSNKYMAKYFDSTRGYPNGLDHVFVRGYVYFKTPEPGGTVDGIQRKMIYLFDKTSSATWWLFMVTDSSAGRLPMRIATNSSVGVPAVSYWNLTTLDYDQWYCVEMEVKPNTPGASDGLLRVWINGTQVWERLNLNLRGTATTGIQSVRIGEQANRLNFNPVNEYRYWDDVKISTSYIGPE